MLTTGHVAISVCAPALHTPRSNAAVGGLCSSYAAVSCFPQWLGWEPTHPLLTGSRRSRRGLQSAGTSVSRET